MQTSSEWGYGYYNDKYGGFTIRPIVNQQASGKEAYAVYKDNVLTFYYDNLIQTRTGDIYRADAGEFRTNGYNGWAKYFDNALVKTVAFDPSFGDYHGVTTTSYWFAHNGNSILTEIKGMQYLNTENVTDMTDMFINCRALEAVDVSHFDTHNVTTMLGMFCYCTSIKSLDLTSFDTSKVTDMSYMFGGCNSMTSVDVSSFNTGMVTTMEKMFYFCNNLTSIDVTRFDTHSVTNMVGMFKSCYNLTILDVSSFDTHNVEKMDDATYGGMFEYCSGLTTIYVGDGWSTAGLTTHSDMLFKGCTSLVGGAGTRFDPDHTDYSYAHVDGGNSNPGYFTLKGTSKMGDVNGDGTVDVADMAAIINVMSGHGDSSSRKNADVNGDGIIDVADIAAIVYIMAGSSGTDEDLTFIPDSESEFIVGQDEAIGIFAVSDGNELKASGNYADNVKYILQGTKYTSTTPIVPNGSPMAFYAIAPYRTDASNVMQFQISADQTTLERYKSSNIAAAYVPSTDSRQVALNFKSLLSEVAVKFTGDNIDARTLKVSLNNVLIKADINLNAGTSKGTGALSDVASYADADHTFRAVIAPQTLTTGQVFITVTLDGKEIPMKLKEELTFAPGSKLLYNVKVVGDELVVTSGSFGYDKRLDDVVPPEIREKMGEYIPIYTGVNPPNIEGAYYIKPFTTVYCEDENEGGFSPGFVISDYVLRFFDQNDIDNTINFAERSSSAQSYSEGTGSFISGYGNYFTVYLSVDGVSNYQDYSVTTKMATVISGIKDENGIRDLNYAFVLVDKSDDPEHHIMNVGFFRVFNDGDNFSERTTWEKSSRGPLKVSASDYLLPWGYVKKQ